jgi:lysophospholipase L1-like esterase
VSKQRIEILKRLHRVAVGAAVVFGSFIIFGTMQTGATGMPNTSNPAAYYLALGGSGSLGVQPTVDRPKGQPTTSGYANDLLKLERSRWSGLHLVQLGCPGETTGSFLAGGDHCRPAGRSQLAEAVSFLHSHTNVVLVTIDLGFNNMLPCLAYHKVNQTCVLGKLATVQQQLTQILARLHEADPSLRIVGVGHYDPYLYAHIDDFAVKDFVSASIAVIDRLNAVLRFVYSAAGVPTANVGAAFALANAVPTTRTNGTTAPKDLVRLCALTWACTSPPLRNSHPNEDGYEVIAESIADVVRT